jgi:hypothetical protein
LSGKLPVYEFTTIGDFCKENPIDVAVVCVPMEHAQEATNAAMAAGVKAIWNFTNAVLEVPAGIIKEDIYFSDSLLTLEYYLADYKKRADTLTKKEQDQIRDMKIVQEMYARGFEFLKIDLYKARAKEFQIIDGKLMPSFASIDGLGDKAADQLVEAAKDGTFLSKDDLRSRAKLSKTVVDLMEELGIIEGMPESNQLSLFDFT